MKLRKKQQHNDLHPSQKRKRWLLICAIAVCGIIPAVAHAHKLKQVRIFHILTKGKEIHLYINLLLPKSPKSMLWQRLFDRNRNGRLEAAEQQALGKMLRIQVMRGVSVEDSGHPLQWKLREVQNSRLRGTPQKRKYSWDYHFLAVSPHATNAKRQLVVKARALIRDEVNPIALVAVDGKRLASTRTSYVLRRNKVDRAICKLTPKRRQCTFAWRAKPTPNQTMARPTTQPTKTPTNKQD